MSNEQLDETKRRRAQRERAEWAELYHIYDRCVVIAESIWDKRLDDASAQQQALTEAMRDRMVESPYMGVGDLRHSEILVPLFTPRDRLQFIKEAAATLLISADRRNLTALYKDPNGETELAQAKEAVASEDPVEAASGADETGDPADAPLALAQEASDYGEPLSEAPTPRV